MDRIIKKLSKMIEIACSLGLGEKDFNDRERLSET